MTTETDGDILRRVERQRGDDWGMCRMVELKVGDVFRMFEPSGVSVVGPQGAIAFKVTGVPKLLGNGAVSIDADMVIP